MTKKQPGLYGITYSNRDFTQADTWGKNQFNSSFPVGLTNFISSKNLDVKKGWTEFIKSRKTT